VGMEWREFSKGLLVIRKQGYCISESELHAGRTGVAAPIFDEKRRVLGSLTLVGHSERFRAYQESYLSGLVMESAAELTRRIALQ